MHRFTLCSLLPLPWCPKEKAKTEAADPGTFYKIEHLFTDEVEIIKRPPLPEIHEGIIGKIEDFFMGERHQEDIAKKETTDVKIVKKSVTPKGIGRRLANIFTCGTVYSDEFEPKIREQSDAKDNSKK